MLVSKSFVNIYLSLQHSGAKGENKQRRPSHLCLILSHGEHVHYLYMCGPELPSAERQELQKLRASGCTSRLQKEYILSEQRIHCQPGTQGFPSFSLLCFLFCCFSLCTSSSSPFYFYYKTQCLVFQIYMPWSVL